MNKRKLDFIHNQIKQIVEGGFLVLLQKLCAFPLVILAIPVAVFVRLLRPWVIVRFGVLQSDRIGHFAGNTEIYLCECDAGLYGLRNFDIFYYNAKISNYQLKKMWDRTLRVWSFAKWVDISNRLLPAAETHIVRLNSDRDIYCFFKNTSVHISFTTQEEYLGKKELERFGVLDSPFVCFLARDSAYLNSLYPGRSWQYHDFRECDIRNYLLSIDELTRQGYFAFRMGKLVKEKLVTDNPKIIDYATNSRSDFLDIYLSAKCRFFISSGAGIDTVSAIFRKPVAYVNIIPLGPVDAFWINSLFIPKKLWLKEEKRFLTFREILDSDVKELFQSKLYRERGIEVIQNTPEEINSLVMEMEGRLSGKWEATREDEELQCRFWSLFKPGSPDRIFPSRIGKQFLRENQDLLV